MRTRPEAWQLGARCIIFNFPQACALPLGHISSESGAALCLLFAFNRAIIFINEYTSQ